MTTEQESKAVEKKRLERASVGSIGAFALLVLWQIILAWASRLAEDPDHAFRLKRMAAMFVGLPCMVALLGFYASGLVGTIQVVVYHREQARSSPLALLSYMFLVLTPVMLFVSKLLAGN